MSLNIQDDETFEVQVFHPSRTWSPTGRDIYSGLSESIYCIVTEKLNGNKVAFYQ